jgi:hypothetical protein
MVSDKFGRSWRVSFEGCLVHRCLDAGSAAVRNPGYTPSSLDELLSDAARVGRTLIHIGDWELASSGALLYELV